MKWISSKIRRQILLSPFLLAIPFTLLIIVLLPDLFPKFRSELIEKGFIDKPGGYEYWEDIDHDGNSERIVLFNNTEGKASVKIIEENGYIGDHYYCRGKYIVIKTLPVKTGNDWKLVSLLYKIAPGNYSPRLILTTVQGEVITVRGLGDTLERPAMDIFFIGQDREYIYLSGQHGQIEKIHDFSSPLYLDLPASIESRFVQIKTPESGRSTIAIQQAGIYYHYSYEKNRFYFLKFPFYMGIYVFILGFIHLIRRLQQVQLEQRKKLSDEITALQLKSIKSQFDPHLTFNIMTSISYAVHQGNKELANQFIARFSAFIRDIVTDSDQISRTLGNELTFVTRYLEGEKMRLQQFEYVITTPEGLNLTVEIPKNIVLTFVENAVKHGIRPKESPGKITIRIEKMIDDQMEICIEDDGAGRSVTKDAGLESTGKGLLIVEQILDLWYKLKGKRITWTIEDLTGDGKPVGTRVRVVIPA